MNREEGMELVQRSIDGDLNEEETTRMLAYVQAYPDCAAMLERLTRLSKELAQLPQVTPRYSLVDAILPQLEQLSPEPAPDLAIAGFDDPLASPGPRARRRTTRSSLYRRLASVVGVAVVAGFVITGQQMGLFNTVAKQDSASSQALLDTQMPASQAAAAGSEDKSRLKVRFNAAIPSAESPSVTSKNQNATPDAKSAMPEAESGDIKHNPQEGTSKGAVSPTDPIASSSATDSHKTLSNQASPSTSSSPTPKVGAKSTAEGSSTQDMALTGTSTGDTKYSIAAPAPLQWPAPDAALTAYTQAGTGAVSVVKAEDGSLVFQSAPREGEISNVQWTEDGKELDYTWTDTAGKATNLKWDAAANQESTR